MKLCNRCQVIKPLSEFYDNGRGKGKPKSYCKECHKAKMREKYWTHKGKGGQERREYQRKMGRQSYHRNREANLRRVADYRQKNPEKLRAHWAAAWAQQKGILTSPGVCSHCGSPGPLEKHHPDYSRPLEVIWLCTPCHRLLHLGKEPINIQEVSDGQESHSEIG